jgi:hypothetical protein
MVALLMETTCACSLIPKDHVINLEPAPLSIAGPSIEEKVTTTQAEAAPAQASKQEAEEEEEQSTPEEEHEKSSGPDLLAILGPNKHHYSGYQLPSTQTTVCISTASGSRYILGPAGKLIKIYTAQSPLSPMALPGLSSLSKWDGWKAAQTKVTPEMDPNGLLYKRIRIFWPVDNTWYTGRIIRYK